MHNRLPNARHFLAEADKDAILSAAVFLLFLGIVIDASGYSTRNLFLVSLGFASAVVVTARVVVTVSTFVDVTAETDVGIPSESDRHCNSTFSLPCIGRRRGSTLHAF